MPAIGTDNQIGAHFAHPFRRSDPHPDRAAAFKHRVGDVGAHHQAKAPVASTLRRQKVEEIPLRHKGDEFAHGRQMAKIRNSHALVADLRGGFLKPLMWQLQKLVQQPYLVHEFERRGMDRVSAEITQEVGMLFQHQHIDTGTCQQETKHHAGRPAPDDATALGDIFSHRIESPVQAFNRIAPRRHSSA